MKYFVEKEAFTRREKKYHWQESLENEGQMVSISQKISCPLAKINSFFEF